MSQIPNTAATATAALPPGRTPRFTPLDPLRILRRYLWVWIIIGVIGIILGIVSTIVLQIFMPRYTSISMMLVSAELEDVFDVALDPSGTQDRQDALTTFMANQVLRIESQQVLDRALERQDVRNTGWFKAFPRSSRDAFEELQDNLSVRVLRGSSLIEVAFTGPQESDMAKIVAAVNQSFLEQYKVDLLNRQTRVRVMMSQEEARARDELEEIEKELEAYLEEHDVPRLDSRGTEAQIAYQTLAQRRILLEMTLEQLKQRYAEMQREMADPQFNLRPELSTAHDREPRIAYRINQLEQLEQATLLLGYRLGPNHRSIKKMRNNIGVLRGSINTLRDQLVRQSQAAALTGGQRNMERMYLQIEALKPQLDMARESIRDLDSKLSEYQRMAERREAVKNRYERAQELLEDIRMRELRPENVRITIQQQPTTAELTFPRYVIMVPSITLLCIGLTAGVVFLKEMLDQRIKSPSDLELLPNAALLGVVPSATEDPTGPDTVEGIVSKDPTGLIAEAFRKVRTEILARMDRRGYKTLMLVGAQAQCGTSNMVSNLGASIAFNGRRVAIIDANFRRPGQCKLFGAETTPGLVEVLKGEVLLEDAIVHHAVPQVDVLPTGDGATTAPEALDGEAFRQLLARLENEYDITLIDAPPAIVASDSKLLSKQVDAMAMVVRAKSEKRGMVSRMLKELGGQRADVLGIILNGVKSSSGGYFRKNYQAFYRYRQGPDRKAEPAEVVETVNQA